MSATGKRRSGNRVGTVVGIVIFFVLLFALAMTAFMFVTSVVLFFVGGTEAVRKAWTAGGSGTGRDFVALLLGLVVGWPLGGVLAMRLWSRLMIRTGLMDPTSFGR